jgi:hypothetical protein
MPHTAERLRPTRDIVEQPAREEADHDEHKTVAGESLKDQPKTRAPRGHCLCRHLHTVHANLLAIRPASLRFMQRQGTACKLNLSRLLCVKTSRSVMPQCDRAAPPRHRRSPCRSRLARWSRRGYRMGATSIRRQADQPSSLCFDAQYRAPSGAAVCATALSGISPRTARPHSRRPAPNPHGLLRRADGTLIVAKEGADRIVARGHSGDLHGAATRSGNASRSVTGRIDCLLLATRWPRAGWRHLRHASLTTCQQPHTGLPHVRGISPGVLGSCWYSPASRISGSLPRDIRMRPGRSCSPSGVTTTCTSPG